MPQNPEPTKVTIVGAGIAGLTVAFRLAQRGYDVTILEEDLVAGGNLAASRPPNDHQAVLEVYPHMFGEWYANFWKLIADVGVTREANFEQRPACGYLRRGEFPQYRLLRDNGSLRTALPNLFSGIMSVPNMFLAAYAIIDLLTADFGRDDMASEQTLNGFLVTRPYATEDVAQFFRSLILNIWSLDSYLTSAGAYQSFAKYQFREPSPQSWILRTNSYDAIIKPLIAELKKRKCKIRLGEKVTGVTVSKGRKKVTHISILSQDEPVENLILAIRPTALHDLISNKSPAAQPPAWDTPDYDDVIRAMGDRVPIASILPQLANTRRLATMPIPVIYVTFRRALPDIPDFYVALADSKYSLTFVKIEALTRRRGHTVLAVAASDFNALPVDPRPPAWTDELPEQTEAQRNATFLILTEFQRYVPFRLGRMWRDKDSDVDWEHTYMVSGPNQELFINQVGSEHACPYTHYPEVENLYFAGENRDNPITIATVEAAVCSGLQAAQALCRQEGSAAGTNPIEIIEPRGYPLGLLLAWKFGLAPYAALAKCLAVAEDLSRGQTAGRPAPSRSTTPGAVSLVAQSVASASNAYCQWWAAVGSSIGQLARAIGMR